MNVVLVHPIHGAKVAINAQELEHDEKLGWTRYTPDAPAEKPVESASVEESPAKRKYSRRVTRQPIEQPNSDTLASDESEEI